jgi:hypothetical protein
MNDVRAEVAVGGTPGRNRRGRSSADSLREARAWGVCRGGAGTFIAPSRRPAVEELIVQDMVSILSHIVYSPAILCCTSRRAIG